MRRDVQLVVATSRTPSREEFLGRLGLSTDGLGAYFFGSVYDALFADSTEARSEYDRFYSVEYGSLAQYLDQVYDVELTEEEIAQPRVYLVHWLPQVIDPDYEDSKLDDVLAVIEEISRECHEGQA